MMKFKSCMILTAFAAAGLLSAADWRIKDGTGSLVLKDSSPDGIDLKIATPETVTWAREDDRGFFLNFSGGYAAGPGEKLLFPDGMVLEIFFSPDLERGREWLPLVTCGNSFTSGCSVWVRKTGQILVSLPGTKKSYGLWDAKLKNLRDCRLRVVRGGGRVQVSVDGKVIADYASPGKVACRPGEPFRLGSSAKWKFYGNIYSVKLTGFVPGAFDAGVEKKKVYPGEEVRPVPGIEDPEGTVIFSDFRKFFPRPVVGQDVHAWRWVCRRIGFFPGHKYVLMCASDPDEAVIGYKPEIRGVFDIYFGLRMNTKPSDFIFSVPDRETRYRVRIGAASPSYHPNTEVLVAKDVRMDGGEIAFFPGGRMFLGYIKFIPSANRRKKDYPKWKCVTVGRTQKTFREISAERIRTRIATGHFKERVFVDGRPVPEPGPEARKFGYILSRHDWMDLCFAAGRPAAAQEKLALACAAAPGEFEPVCFSLHGLEDCGEVTLTGADALEKQGIAGTVAVVRELPKRTTNIYDASEFIRGPQYLERTNSTRLGRGVSRQFWLTFKVGKNAKPGDYKCVLTLSSAKGKRVIPLTVTVRPFKLDPVIRERTGIFTMHGEYRRHPGLIREMSEHGCGVAWLRIDRDVIVRADGSVDWKNSRLPAIAAEMKKYGMRTIVLETVFMAGKFFTLPDGAARYTRAIREILARAEKENWPEILFYTYDEVLSNPRHLPMVLWETPLLKACKAGVVASHLWYRTSRPYQKQVDKLAPLADVFMLRFNTRNFWYVDTWRDIMERCRREGRELWSYNIDNAILFAQPAMKRFAFGWFFRTLGKYATGQLLYAYCSYESSPYTDLDGDGRSVDWCYNLPERPGHKGGFAIDFEAVREGVDDLRYITTLENRIAEAKKKGLTREAAEAERVLDGLKNSFDFGKKFTQNSVFLDSHFEKAWEMDGRRYCSGRYNLPNGWRFEDYHAAREKIAGEIVKLDKAMGK